MASAKGPRIVFIGSAAVGKTTLIMRVLESRYVEQLAPTPCATFYRCKCTHAAHPEVQLWDTGGMERYRSVNQVFYRDAVGALLVFDLTSHVSFEEIDSWLQEFITNARPNPSVVLCGNKKDLIDERDVEDNEITSFCRARGNLSFFETSAVTGEGVDLALMTLLDLIPVDEHPVQTAVLLPEAPKEKKCCE
jgi:small GTP-binding protein